MDHTETRDITSVSLPTLPSSQTSSRGGTRQNSGRRMTASARASNLQKAREKQKSPGPEVPTIKKKSGPKKSLGWRHTKKQRLSGEGESPKPKAQSPQVSQPTTGIASANSKYEVDIVEKDRIMAFEKLAAKYPSAVTTNNFSSSSESEAHPTSKVAFDALDTEMSKEAKRILAVYV